MMKAERSIRSSIKAILEISFRDQMETHSLPKQMRGPCENIMVASHIFDSCSLVRFNHLRISVDVAMGWLPFRFKEIRIRVDLRVSAGGIRLATQGDLRVSLTSQV